MTTSDSKFEILRQKGTLAHDADLGTDGLIERLSAWDGRYGISLSDVSANSVMVTFATVPTDLDAFADEVCSICPDVVYEHFTSFVDLAEYNSNPNYQKAIDGLDEMDDDFGLKAMKRWIALERTLPLWWG